MGKIKHNALWGTNYEPLWSLCLVWVCTDLRLQRKRKLILILANFYCRPNIKHPIYSLKIIANLSHN